MSMIALTQLDSKSGSGGHHHMKAMGSDLGLLFGFVTD